MLDFFGIFIRVIQNSPFDKVTHTYCCRILLLYKLLFTLACLLNYQNFVRIISKINSYNIKIGTYTILIEK